ncbi:MAG: AAA family ATPase [Chitinophagaceae bacterium]
MQKPIKKIVVIGPESTGKSVLCARLAAYYQTVWGVEYARNYLLMHGKNYQFSDLLTIAKGQIEVEERAIQQASQLMPETNKEGLVFLDTNMYVMKVWCEYVFNQCHQFVLEEIANRHYDFYILCNVDLPWEADELREYPDEKPRRELFEIYKEILVNQPTPWVQVNGIGEERILNAVNAIDEWLKATI